MQEYVKELSKYAIAILMAVHTFCGFLSLSDRMEKSSAVHVLQNMLLFTIQFLMFINLGLAAKDMQYIFFYVFVQAFLLAAAIMVPIVYEKVNRLLLNNMCMLLGTGMCVISRLSFKKAVKQYVIVLVSLAVSLFIPWLLSRIRFLKKLTWVYAGVGIAMLSAVLILGEVTHGSKLSFSISGVTFQPSEFVKIIFVFFLAGALWENTSFTRVALTAVLAGVHVVVLVVSKDLGSALIFFIAYVFVVFAATRNYFYLLAGALGGSGAAWGAYRLFSHVRDRVTAWQNPWTYIDSKGYAITQSLFAIGTGSWFGMGLFQGNPRAIPYVEADLADEKLPLSNMSLHTNYLLWVIVGLSVTGTFILFLLYRERKLKAASKKPDQTGQSEEKEQPDTVEETGTAKEDGSAHIEGTGEPAEPNEPEEQP